MTRHIHYFFFLYYLKLFPPNFGKNLEIFEKLPESKSISDVKNS